MGEHPGSNEVRGPQPVRIGRKARKSIVAGLCLDAEKLTEDFRETESPEAIDAAHRRLTEHVDFIRELETGELLWLDSVRATKALIVEEEGRIQSDIGDIAVHSGGPERMWQEEKSRQLLRQARRLRKVLLQCVRFEAEWAEWAPSSPAIDAEPLGI